MNNNQIKFSLNCTMIQSIWITILILLILITTGGALININPIVTDFLNIVIFLLSIKPISYILFNKKDFIIILFISIIWILINAILNIDTIINSLVFIFRFVTVFAIVKYCNLKKINISEHIYRLVSFISLYSLIFYIMIQMLKLSLPVKYIDAGNYMIYKSYFNIFYWLQSFNINGQILIRNSSIFWEPGMYQIFINYCIFYVFFMKNSVTKMDKINIFLLTISLFTTTSTTGIMLLMILFSLKIYSIESNNRSLVLLKIFISLLLSVSSIFIIIYLLGKKSDNISMSLRINDLLIPIKLFLAKPIFGWGYLNYDIYTKVSGNYGNSNGVTTLIYQTGLIGICLYTIFTMMLINKMKKEKYTIYGRISLFIFVVISNMTEPIIYSNFTILFLAMGYFGSCNKFENRII